MMIMLDFIKIIVVVYLKTRIHHECQKINNVQGRVRSILNKTVLFKINKQYFYKSCVSFHL